MTRLHDMSPDASFLDVADCLRAYAVELGEIAAACRRSIRSNVANSIFGKFGSTVQRSLGWLVMAALACVAIVVCMCAWLYVRNIATHVVVTVVAEDQRLLRQAAVDDQPSKAMCEDDSFAIPGETVKSLAVGAMNSCSGPVPATLNARLNIDMGPETCDHLLIHGAPPVSHGPGGLRHAGLLRPSTGEV